MNATTLENTSFCDNFLNTGLTIIPNLASLIIRLPVNIYVLQQIISRHWITSEFYPLNEAVFELIICVDDILGVVESVLMNAYLRTCRRFFLGFTVTGRPCLLVLICLERYLAVVKPVFFLKLKPLKYKLAFSGIVWLCTLVSCSGSIFMTSVFYNVTVWQITMCFMVKLYCCVATLYALKRPPPGEGVRQREGMNDMKLKAFRIILIITMSVILMYVPLVLSILLQHNFTQQQFATTLNACYICTAASGFVQASLFLHRSGKLAFIKWP